MKVEYGSLVDNMVNLNILELVIVFSLVCLRLVRFRYLGTGNNNISSQSCIASGSKTLIYRLKSLQNFFILPKFTGAITTVLFIF